MAVEPPRAPAPGGDRACGRAVWPVALAAADCPAAGGVGGARRPVRSSTCPVLHGFNFQGGGTISPGVLRPAARAGALHRRLHRRDRPLRHPGGAARPVGGGRRARPAPRAVLRRIVLPQALRVIIPPMTSQYLNLTKNSSLAVAIGYPGHGVDRQHDAEPDRPGDRGHRRSSWRSTSPSACRSACS